MAVQLFTYEEVSTHNTRDDLYMIINNKVYDITKFVDEHPGGEEVLVDEGAKDATASFNDIGHSPEASEMLEKYYIGDVDTSSAPVKGSAPNNSTSTVGDSPQGNPLRIIIPLSIILGYLYFRFFVKA
ncbi:cytochrome b5-like heme/steroid binding domain-containing protein [Phycomyces nitens]|nr:cytochrome b5-like heme/steroid binding domain-containing protein [Phycomyces nitens]